MVLGWDAVSYERGTPVAIGIRVVLQQLPMPLEVVARPAFAEENLVSSKIDGSRVQSARSGPRRSKTDAKGRVYRMLCRAKQS